MRNKITKLIVLLVTIPFVLTACSKDEETEDSYESVKQKRMEKMTEEAEKDFLASQKKPLAIVNGKKIFQQDLENGDLNETVTNEVLYQVAEDRGIVKKVKPKVETYERNLVLDSIKEQIKKEIRSNVSEEEISAYYNDHKHEYALVEMEELATGKEDLAYDVKRESSKGIDFKSIPALFNTDNSQNVIYRNSSSIVGVFFSDAIKIGQISQVIESNDQYIVQKAVSKRQPTYDELKDIISINLLKQKTQNSYDEAIEALKKKKKVQIMADSQNPEESTAVK